MKCISQLMILMLLGTIPLLHSQVSADCSSAVPICNDTPVNGGTQGYGIDDFNGAARTGCLEQTTSGFIESNSAWYRFRTGASGQLGFDIGFDASEDWDFALYKATDCNQLGEPVSCNFFDNSDGQTYMGVGEDPTGDTATVLYEPWLQVEAGEDYYLMINNFSNTNSGFSIRFSGAIFDTNPSDALDCSIVSNLLGPPVAACDNETVVLDATSSGALAYSWYMDDGSGYTLLSGETNPTYQPVTSAMYRVVVDMGAGNTTISDVQVGFSTAPTAFPVKDEILCSAVGILDLRQKDAEVLGSQPAGDYIITYHADQASADTGANPLPTQYPLAAGSQTIYVRIASILNPSCADSSEQFNLQVTESPVIDFETDVYICENSNSITIGDISPVAGYSYAWDTGQSSPNITVTTEGTYTVSISNSGYGINCTEIVSVQVVISESPAIADVVIEGLRDSNNVEIISAGSGDYEFRIDQGPYQSDSRFTDVPPGVHTVTINDLKGCGTVTESITVVGFPKFFTPNGDGNNDRWHIVGIEQLTSPLISIYDRFGKLLRSMDQNSPGWDGTFNGRELPAADYWFRLTFVDAGGQRLPAKFIDNHFSLAR